jgi:hypothetical protein
MRSCGKRGPRRSIKHEAIICLPHDGVATNNITGKRYIDHWNKVGFECATPIKNTGMGAAMMRSIQLHSTTAAVQCPLCNRGCGSHDQRTGQSKSPSRRMSAWSKTGLVQCSKSRGYSISSSARDSSVGGTVMPSALAVFILMTSWKRVGCSTGKSAG